MLLSPVGGGGIDVVPAAEELPLVELAGGGGGEAVSVDVSTLLYNPDRQCHTKTKSRRTEAVHFTSPARGEGG